MMMPFWDHIEELRRTFVRIGWTILTATLVTFCFHRPLFATLLAPLGCEKLYLFDPLEGFVMAIKISFWGGIVLSSPLWLYFILRFFLPALQKKEKSLIFPFLILSCMCILGGIAFAYVITLPFVSSYFIQFNVGLGENLWGFKEMVNFTLGLILAHALVFELYVILLFLIHYRLLKHDPLKKMRKGIIVAIFILAAVLTPPDVLSQLLLAFPMMILFETALFFARIKCRQTVFKKDFFSLKNNNFLCLKHCNSRMNNECSITSPHHQ
jgi:Tat protein translocase TatC